jgi:glycosyltransferase involved in cell wall biosynthesis
MLNQARWYLRRLASLLDGVVRSLRELGVRGATEYVLRTIRLRRQRRLSANYHAWFIGHLRSRMKSHEPPILKQGPLISVVVPVFRPPLRFLEACISSVKSQVYPHWQLVLVDDGGGDERVASLIRQQAKQDIRIEAIVLEDNVGISAATNAAIGACKGEFVCFLDHDDLLTPDALLLAALKIKDDPSIDFLYADEDKLSLSNTFVEPSFRSFPSPDLLLSYNCMSHPLAVRRDLILHIGGLRPGFEGAQDHDLALRLLDSGAGIAHLDEVTYHWRISGQSAAASHTAKPYAYEAGLRAVQESLRRRGLQATARRGVVPGHYEVLFHLPPQGTLGVVVHARGDIRKVLENLRYVIAPDISELKVRVVVVRTPIPEDGFADANTIQDWPPEWSEVEGTVAIYRGWPNRAAALNWGCALLGVTDYLLFVEDDVFVPNPSVLRQLLSNLDRPDVGAVGTTEIGPDGLIRQSGIMVTREGVEYAYAGEDSRRTLHHNLSRCLRDVSALSGSFMLTKTSVFTELGRFSETLEQKFFDIAYCMNIREKTGKRVVLDPLFPVMKHGPGRLMKSSAVSDYEELAFKQLLHRHADERDRNHAHGSLSILLGLPY